MIQPRRIFFHIGAPKTGTSAIQMFLASNIGNLRAIGLDYLKREPPREGLPTTGNGASVFRYFKRAQGPREKLEGLLDGYFGTENGAVVPKGRRFDRFHNHGALFRRPFFLQVVFSKLSIGVRSGPRIGIQ